MHIKADDKRTKELRRLASDIFYSWKDGFIKAIFILGYLPLSFFHDSDLNAYVYRSVFNFIPAGEIYTSSSESHTADMLRYKRFVIEELKEIAVVLNQNLKNMGFDSMAGSRELKDYVLLKTIKSTVDTYRKGI